MAHGSWLMVLCSWLMVHDSWLMVHGHGHGLATPWPGGAGPGTLGTQGPWGPKEP